MKQCRYETHLHTWPVSKCAKKSVEENLLFYKSLDYKGVFITNHFIDGNINMGKTLPAGDLLEFYISDYEKAKEIGKNLELDVFFGVEMTYQRTDFLVYGLSPDWYFAHSEIRNAEKHELLPYLQAKGALVIHAHPFREGRGIHTLRLYPRSVHGVETFNACRTEFENHMAEVYAQEYGLLPFAGTDNHKGEEQRLLGGMETDSPLLDESDFVRRVLDGGAKPFRLALEPLPEG